MIAWCYYGERGWIYVLDHFGGLGLRTVIIFRIAFIGFILFGAVEKLENVLSFRICWSSVWLSQISWEVLFSRPGYWKNSEIIGAATPPGK